MHIKSLTIQGFKSYRDQTTAEFHPGTTILVGRNGSGKSNFFSAIRFVLSDAYTSLQREERQSLLHEGDGGGATGAQTFSAYVEIVFDNNDGRFPTGKETLTLRRTIGAKKDDYQLDRKSTSKGEVMSILESAGFSRSNPYYIVPQGRITFLTNLKDTERLDLLKEVAGTKVYEDRRAESVRIMEDTDQKRTKIEELLKYIEERLNELEEEKEELKEFQAQDRERRCLEYAIYQREFEEVGETLEQVEQERRNDSVHAGKQQKEFASRQKEIQNLNTQITELEQELILLKIDSDQASGDRKEAVKSRTQIELIIKDMQEAIRKGEGRKAQLQEQLNVIQEQISEKETELMEINPEYEDKLTEETNLLADLGSKETTHQTLLSKQGRMSQFTTQSQRDTYLRSENTKMTSLLSKHREHMSGLERELEGLKRDLEENLGKQEDGKVTREGRREVLMRLREEVETLEKRTDQVHERRKEIWRDSERLSQHLQHEESKLRKAEDALYRTMDRQTTEGLRHLRNDVNRHNIPGVYGPLYELFDVEEKYWTAVEVVAGNSLFHVVVDNDSTATKVLSYLNQHKDGRVTFMPLNRLRTRTYNYPQAADAVPMIRKLDFDRTHSAAFEQVFGRALICINLEIASQYTRSEGFDGITIQGDKADRKGTYTGGYHDPNRSRLSAVKQLTEARKKYEAHKKEMNEIIKDKEKVSEEANQSAGELASKKTRFITMQNGRESLANELLMLEREESSLRDEIQKKDAMLKGRQVEVRNLEMAIAANEQELRTPMTQNLSAEEQETLRTVTNEIDRSKRRLAELRQSIAELGSQKSNLEIELKEDLKRRREQFESQLEGLMDPAATQISDGEGIQTRQRELNNLNERVATLLNKIEELTEKIERKTTGLENLHTELEKLQNNQVEDGRGIERQKKNVERYIAKKDLLTQRKEECSKNIRDLGVLPEEAFEKYTRTQTDKLVKSLHKVKEGLKKFSHVNKKAFEQYSNFTKQRDELKQRHIDLDNSAESIEELIQTLDQRKDEAIERTFKQVSKYFEEVFGKLVPVGRGRLIMQKRLDGDDDEAEEEEDEAEEAEEDEEEDDDDEEEEEEEDEEEDDAMDIDQEDEDDAASRRRKRKGKGKQTPASRAKGKQPAKGKDKGKSKGDAKGKGKSKAKGKGKSKESKDRSKKKSKIDNYTGVAIKVSFNSKVDEGLRIQQLSGGQKSLVALAMVFAIQKCDPAPFYLFDEIDANLDADRRTAVANMIHSLSSGAQFIITTFRPELIANADHFLGVTFDARKISSIFSIDKDKAYDFVEANDRAGAREEVPAVGGSVVDGEGEDEEMDEEDEEE